MYYYIMYVLGRLRKKYFNQIPENKQQYFNSRRAFTIDGITASTISSLVANTYIAGFLTFAGLSDSLNGIIAAFPILFSIGQPLGAFLSQRFKKKKLFVTAGAITHRTMFTLMYLVPLFTNNKMLRITLILILFGGANFISAFISPSASNWLISLTPQRLRGRYYGLREKYSVIVLSIIGLIAGYMLDFFGKKGMQTVSYVYMAVIIGIIAIVNFGALTSVMEPESIEKRQTDISIAKAFIMPFKEKNFRPIIIMGILWNIGMQCILPYHAIFIVGYLKVSYFYLSIVGIICGAVKALCLPSWGKIADRTSWAFVCKTSMAIIAFTHIVNIFLTPSNATWLYLINSVIANVGWAVITVAMLNIQYDFAPPQGRTIYIGVNAAITGIIGYIGVFFGAFVMKLVEIYNPVIYGIDIKGQYILNIICVGFVTSCVIYIQKVVQKNKKIITVEGLSV